MGLGTVAHIVVVEVHHHCQRRAQQETEPHKAVAIVTSEVVS